MLKLTKIIAPALVVGLAMTATVPAQANYYDDPRQIRSEIRQFERQVERITYDRSVSQRNATWLSYRLRGIENQFYRFRRGGFNDWEMSTLNHSLQIFQDELDRRTGRNFRRGYRSNRGYNDGHDYRRGHGSRDGRRYWRSGRRHDW